MSDATFQAISGVTHTYGCVEFECLLLTGSQEYATPEVYYAPEMKVAGQVAHTAMQLKYPFPHPTTFNERLKHSAWGVTRRDPSENVKAKAVYAAVDRTVAKIEALITNFTALVGAGKVCPTVLDHLGEALVEVKKLQLGEHPGFKDISAQFKFSRASAF